MNRPIVLDAPPSPLHYLLSGLSQGVMTGMENRKKQEEGRKNAMAQILEGVMSGSVDPRMLATSTGQDFLKSQGLTGEEPIARLLEEGRRQANLLGPGDMGPPKPYGIDDYQAQLSQEAAARKEAEIQEARRRLNMEERIKQKHKPEKPEKKDLTPEEKVEEIYRIQEEAKRRNMPLDDINIGGVNVRTQGEIEKDYFAKMEKQQTEAKGYEAMYNANREDVLEFKTGATKTLTSYLSAKTVDSISPIMANMIMYGGSPGEIEPIIENKSLTPERRARLVAAVMNKQIKEYNRNLMNDGIKAGKSKDEIYQEELIDVDEILGKSKKGKTFFEKGVDFIKKVATGPEGQPSNPVNKPKVDVANAKSGEESRKKISAAHTGINNIRSEIEEMDKDFSIQALKDEIIGSKEEIKKQYGLNEAEFQTLISMIK
jgi:hypothetical protein